MDYLKNAKFGIRPDMPSLQEFKTWYEIIRRHGISHKEITAVEIGNLLRKTGLIK